MRIAILTGILAFTLPLDAQQQARTLKEPHTGGSPNIHVAAYVPLGAGETVSDIEMEQELSRPYVYLGQFAFGRSGTPAVGVDVVDSGNPDAAKVIYRWRIENLELHLKMDGLRRLERTLQAPRPVLPNVQSSQFQDWDNGPDEEVPCGRTRRERATIWSGTLPLPAQGNGWTSGFMEIWPHGATQDRNHNRMLSYCSPSSRDFYCRVRPGDAS